MPIFTESDDKSKYFPDLTLTGAAFDAFILQVQSIIESPLGANRPLEKKPHKQKLRLNTTLQTVYLDYTPIDLAIAPVVRARIGNAVASVTGQVIPQHDWTVLDSQQYFLDEDGKLSLNTNRGGNLSFAYGSANLGYSSIFTECEVEYTGGYDFTDENDAIAQQLKGSAAAVAKYMWGSNGNSGFTGKQIRSKDVDDEYKVDYFAGASNSSDGLYGSGVGQIPKALMLPFIQLKGVSYGF